MRILLRIVGVLMILSALVLFFWQDIQELMTKRVNDRVIEAYHNGDDSVDINFIESYITGIDPNAEADSVNEENDDSVNDDNQNSNEDELEQTENTDSEQSTIQLGDNIAGILSIPSVNINEPIFIGPVTESKLRNGLSLVSAGDHVGMQNLPIAGHRVEGVGIRFNYLDRASVGDEITITTRDGQKTYKITQIFNVDPSQVEVLNQHEGSPQELTLITCDSYNPNTLLFEERMIVKAQIV